MQRFVEIHVPGFAPQRHALVGERLTLGTGSRASLRVSGPCQLAAEQAEVIVREQGVLVRMIAGDVLAFEGAEYKSVSVPWGGEVFLGAMRLTFLEGSEASGLSPVLLLSIPVVLLLLGLGAYQAASTDDVSSRDVPAPLLYDEQRARRCPEEQTAMAEHRALDAERAALAKQERSAFDPADAVGALVLLHQARSCFEAAGNIDDSSRILRELTRWNGTLNAHYATLRLRLSRALANGRSADALAAVRELQAMLAHHDEGPYQRWLAQLSRSLERKTSASGS